MIFNLPKYTTILHILPQQFLTPNVSSTYVSSRPGVIVIVIVTITFFTVIVIVNLILKIIVIVDKVIVIHYYFAITFCQTHKSHCHLIGCSIKLSFIILFIIDSVAEKPLHLKHTNHCVLNQIQVDYHRLPIIPQL